MHRSRKLRDTIRLLVFVVFLGVLTAWAVLNLHTSDRELEIAFERQSNRLATGAKKVTDVGVPPGTKETAEEQAEGTKRVQAAEPPADHAIRELAVALLEQAEQAITKAKTLQRERKIEDKSDPGDELKMSPEAETLTREAQQLGKRAVTGLMQQAESLQAYAEESKRRADHAADEAQPLLERALAVQEKTLGPNHAQVALTLHRVAQLYSRQGRYQEAESLLQRALAIQQELPAPDQQSIAEILESYTALLQQTGRGSEADDTAGRIAEILGRQADTAAR